MVYFPDAASQQYCNAWAHGDIATRMLAQVCQPMAQRSYWQGNYWHTYAYDDNI
jgi:hypothetical protein